MNAQSRLLPRIGTELKRHGVSPTQFGYLAVGDPGILKRLRDGRQARQKLLDALQAKLEDLEDWGDI